MKRPRLWRYGLYLLLAYLLAPPLAADTVTRNFTVTATIANGCIFGSSGSGGSGNLGTINFGTLANVANVVDAASTVGAGSLVVTCTPGMAVSIALNGGVNGGSNAQRYLINSGGTRTLAYQLYQDAARSTVWGTGALARSIASFPATTQTLTVYARLLSNGTPPPAGSYSDTVTVTLTW